MERHQTIYALLLCASILFCPHSVLSQEQIHGKEVKTGMLAGRRVQYLDREVAITLNSGSSRAEVFSLLAKRRANFRHDFDKMSWALIEMPAGSDIFLVISELQKLPSVKAAEPNFVDRIQVLEPNDPYFKGTSPAAYPHQWALNNTGQTPPSGTTDADIDAPEAWEITTGSSNVVSAILDSGIPMIDGSLSHPDLDDGSKIILGADIANDGLGHKDWLGHGTHVAGIIGAETDNATGVAGITWGCKLRIIKVSSTGGISDADFYNGGWMQWITSAITRARES